MCKHGDVFSRPVLIGRGLGLDTQFRGNKYLLWRRIVHRYGVLRGRRPSHLSTLMELTQERALSLQSATYFWWLWRQGNTRSLSEHGS